MLVRINMDEGMNQKDPLAVKIVRRSNNLIQFD